MASHTTSSSFAGSPDTLRTRSSPYRNGQTPRSLSIDPLAANRPPPPKQPLYASPRSASHSASNLSHEYHYRPPSTPSSLSSSADAPSFSFSFAPKPSTPPSFYGPPSAAHSTYSAYSNYSSTNDSSPTGSPRLSRRPSLSPVSPLDPGSDEFPIPSTARRPSNASSTASFALSIRNGIQKSARRFSNTASLRSSRQGGDSEGDDGWGSTFEDDWDGCSTGGGSSRRGSFGPLQAGLGPRRGSTGWLRDLGRKTSMSNLRGNRRSSDNFSQSLLSPISPTHTTYNPTLHRKNSVPSLESRSFPPNRRSSLTHYIPIVGGLPQNIRECLVLLVLLLTVLWSLSLFPPVFMTTAPIRTPKQPAYRPVTSAHFAEPRKNAKTFPLLAHELQHQKPAYRPSPPSALQPPKAVAPVAVPKVETPRPFFWDSPREELGSLINYVISSPSHTLSTYIPPNVPLDPQLVLDFSPFAPNAHSLIKVMVDDLFHGTNDAIGLRGKVIIIGRGRDEATQLIVGLLDSLEVFPPPYLIDLDDRSDAPVLAPLFARMLSHSGTLPSLIVNGDVVGDFLAISRLQQSTEGHFYELLTSAGIEFVDPSLSAPFATERPGEGSPLDELEQEERWEDDVFGQIPGEEDQTQQGS